VPLSPRAREAGKAKAMTIKNPMAARRIVSTRLQSYFAMVKELLSTAQFSKIEADLPLAEARVSLP
jgi:hypothetical protein